MRKEDEKLYKLYEDFMDLIENLPPWEVEMAPNLHGVHKTWNNFMVRAGVQFEILPGGTVYRCQGVIMFLDENYKNHIKGIFILEDKNLRDLFGQLRKIEMDEKYFVEDIKEMIKYRQNCQVVELEIIN
jgi:hypothetical protein